MLFKFLIFLVLSIKGLNSLRTQKPLSSGRISGRDGGSLTYQNDNKTCGFPDDTDIYLVTTLDQRQLGFRWFAYFTECFDTSDYDFSNPSSDRNFPLDVQKIFVKSIEARSLVMNIYPKKVDTFLYSIGVYPVDKDVSIAVSEQVENDKWDFFSHDREVFNKLSCTVSVNNRTGVRLIREPRWYEHLDFDNDCNRNVEIFYPGTTKYVSLSVWKILLLLILVTVSIYMLTKLFVCLCNLRCYNSKECFPCCHEEYKPLV